MKKLFFVLALLLAVGVVSNAFATGIPEATDPKNYPTVWTEQVYNGSGSAIVSGLIVQWDFDTSDSGAGTVYDDMCPWVKLTATAEGGWLAGVVPLGQSIANGSTGVIVIKGPTAVKMSAAGNCTVDTLASNNTSGQALDFTGGAADEAVLGMCIKASAAGNDVGAEIGTDYALIYVNPVTYEEN